MGVDCRVNMCVRADAALAPEQRARVVELCVEHGVLRGDCRASAPDDVAPSGPWEWVQRNVLRQPLGEPFHAHGLSPYWNARRGVRIVGDGRVERWDAERIVAIAKEPSFAIHCDAPEWKGRVCDGFVYLASARAVPVRVVNAYRSPEERSPFEPADGVVGAFFDVLTLVARRDLDGRIAAGSPLARAIGKTLGVKLTCRASWT